MNSKIQQLQDLTSNMGQMSAVAPTGGEAPSIDMSQFQMAIAKIQSELKFKANQSDFEALREALDLKADKAALKKEVNRLDALIEELRQSMSDFLDKQSGLKKEVDRLGQFVEMLQKTINSIRNQPTPQPVQTSAVDENQLREIMQRLDAIENELMNFKSEFSRWVKDCQDTLNQKADIDTVKALEQSLLDRLNEIVKALSKQFADKNDTRKALKLLEKNLKNMYDLFMSKGTNENEDDAMFTKKPLGGTSCASCAKDVIDMYGKRVDYHAWGKLPFRDPSERIARIGQGFSKMLSNINPDHLSQYNQGGFQGSSEGLQYDPNMMGQ